MLNRKKMFTDKAVERDLANLRANWGLEGEDFAADYEDVTVAVSGGEDDKIQYAPEE